MDQNYTDRFRHARKQLIKNVFENLNPMQQDAVLTTQGPLLLLAGAGSGKTTVLINRIANLIRFGAASDTDAVPKHITSEDVEYLEYYLQTQDPSLRDYAERLCTYEPCAPWSIIAITFTNKAAGELKERLRMMIGKYAEDVWAMTFHAACCRILRREINRLGYSSEFTIYDSADSERIMKDVLKELNLDEKLFPPKRFLSLISRAKDQMLSPEEFEKKASNSGDFRMEKAAHAYRVYQNRLKDANALDFDDIIFLTVKVLQNYSDVRSYYQNKFQYVLIDEYQDTNHMQYLLASLLAGGHHNICVVGDDDQSIYKFRGATIENILNFEMQYKESKVIRLEENYRSTQAILQAANSLISHNRGRKGKTLWTQNPHGDKVVVYEAQNETDEANYVSSRIFQLSDKKNFHDFAVLYRTNAQSNALENAFKKHGIPYRIIGGTRFFDRAEVKDMLAYLWIINNRSDDLRLRRIINTPARGIGAKTVESISRQADAESISMYAVLADAYNYGPLEKAAKKLTAFSNMIEECASMLDNRSLPEFYDALLSKTGYLAMYEEKNDLESRVKAENVRELRSSIVSYAENADQPSLNGFLEEISLYTDIEQYDPDAEAVVMMTMHSAKGLEFSHVCLVGFEEGLFPGSRSMTSDEDMEEERRLCYVAITRARRTLSISYARQRMLYGQTTVGRPSRFIYELPMACIAEPPEQKRSVNLSYIKQRSSMYGDEIAYVPENHTAKKSIHSSVLLGKKVPEHKEILFRKGDMVRHRAFGRGMVISANVMGNDALLEIAFDEIGTKKLMANSASRHMEKL